MYDLTEHGIQVLDVGFGPGDHLCALAEQFPNSTFVGIDYDPKVIDYAQDIVVKKGLKNTVLLKGDAQNLPTEWTSRFDLVYVYYVLHDLPDPYKCLAQIRRVLKPDGRLSLTEVGYDSDPSGHVGDVTASMFYTMSVFVCLASSLTEPPHTGYGGMWGTDNIQKALVNQGFTILGSHKIDNIGPSTLFMCNK